MTQSFFITGTDTGIGKTFITGLIGRAFQNQGKKVYTQKWVQSGLDGSPTDLTQHLKALHIDERSVTPFLKAMCPYELSLPASPHLSAEEEGVLINPHKISSAYSALLKQCDVLLVEGSGGFHVPFTYDALLSDIVDQLRIPVIMVVGNKLGCINHTLLTLEAIQARKLELYGIIFNTVDPNSPEKILTNNEETILRYSGARHLGSIPYQSSDTTYDQLVSYLTI